jgi:prepilin-type N-terminal cleavage/methylation domain-containing protein
MEADMIGAERNGRTMNTRDNFLTRTGRTEMKLIRKNKRREFRNEKGFTLIEMVLVATLIALLSTMAIASMSMARNKGLETGAAAGLKALASAQEMYYTDNGRYAFGFSALARTYLPRPYSLNAGNGVVIKNYSLRFAQSGHGGPRPPITNFSVQNYTVFALPMDSRLKTFVITDAGAVEVVRGFTNWSPY